MRQMRRKRCGNESHKRRIDQILRYGQRGVQEREKNDRNGEGEMKPESGDEGLGMKRCL